MSARRPTGLTPDELDSLSAGLAAGKRVTVYLRDPMPSLGLQAGASARVVSIDGSTVTVSPKGVDDQLPFEADELQRTRAAATSAGTSRQRSAKASTPAATSRSPRTSAPAPAPTSAPPAKPASPPASDPKSASATTPAVDRTPKTEPARTSPMESKPAQAKPARRPKTPTAAVSVTITAVGESTWTVSVSHGSKKQGKPSEVMADRVARAVRELGDETAISAVDGVIESARAAAQKRIEELSQELEAARAALAHLDGGED